MTSYTFSELQGMTLGSNSRFIRATEVLDKITELEQKILDLEIAAKTGKKPQSQDSQYEQMKRLRVLADKEGLYDAADFLTKNYFEPYDHDTKVMTCKWHPEEKK